MTLPFLDSNLFLRHVLDDHPVHSPRARGLFIRIEAGEYRVRTTEAVVFEVVFTLERSYKTPRWQVRDVILPLIELPGITLPHRPRLRQTFTIYVDLNIPFVDAYHVVAMREVGSTEMISFDTHFDRVEGITRVEPVAN